MKILLIKPPRNPNLVTTSLYEPLELEYLAASVPDHDVHILDMRIDKDLFRELYEFRPELAGITSYTCDYNVVIKILKGIRKFDSKIVTVVGGNHATFLPHDFVIPEIDFIFMGYADSSFPSFVRYLNYPDELRKIPNIAQVRNNNVFFTQKENEKQELDKLPFPARQLTAKYRKFYHDPVRNKIALVMTSRGCPFTCSFCACWK